MKRALSKRHIYRLPPCPTYDIAGMETWLSALAEKGLLLEQDGFFAGVASFSRQKPRKAKYRLEAVQQASGLLSDGGDTPDPDQLALSEKYAWEYVARRGDFFIYRSFDPTARELNTDPAVQALALNSVKKRKRSAMLFSLWFLLLYPLLLTRGCLLLSAIALGTWQTALTLLFALLVIVGDVRAFRHLRRVQRSLMETGCIAPGDRHSTAAYHLGKALRFVLVLILAAALLRSWSVSVTDEDKIPLAEYGGTLPFATMTDLAGAGWSEYAPTMNGMHMGFNTLSERSGLIAPRSITYNEYARLRRADGSLMDGGLYVDYYELCSPWLARPLFRELWRFDRFRQRTDPLSAPALAADEVVAYRDSVHLPTVIFRKGKVVVRVSFHQFGSGDAMPPEAWAGLLCDSLAG